jgi:hypothetical protein
MQDVACGEVIAVAKVHAGEGPCLICTF